MAAATYTARRGYSLTGDEVGAWGARTTEETVGVDETTQLLSGDDVTFTSTVGNWLGLAASLSVVSGKLRVTNTDGVTAGRGYIALICVVGQAYKVAAGFTLGTATSGVLYASTTTSTTQAIASSGSFTASGGMEINFVATATTIYLLLLNTPATVGLYNDFDNVIVTKSGNLISNPNFGVDVGWTKGTGWTISGGVATHAAGTASSVYQSPTGLVAGNSYTFTFTVSGRTAGSVYPRIQDSGSTTVDGTSQTTNATFTETLVAPSNPATLRFGCSSDFDGSIDNISVRLADPDISAEGDGLEHYGQLTYAAVNTGSDLVAASGSTAYNYLRQPYNANLDSDTLSIVVWDKITPNSAIEVIASRGYWTGSAWSGPIVQLIVQADGTLKGYVSDDGGSTSDTITSTAAYDDSEFHQIEFDIDGTYLNLRVDGVSVATPVALSAAVGSLTNTSATLMFGCDQAGLTPHTSGSLALPRFLDVALTAAQVKTRYNDEKHLFEPYSTYTQVGEEYSLDLELSGLAETSDSRRSVNKPISGANEVLLFNDWREFDCTTIPLSRANLSPVAEFLVSAMDGQTITFDPYGTAASPDTPLDCQLDQDSIQRRHVDNRNLTRSISFKIKEVT